MQFCRFAVFTAILQNSLPLFAELPQKRQFGRTFAGTCRIADIMSLRTVKKKCSFAVLPFLRQYGKIVCRSLPNCRKNGNSAELLLDLAELPIL